MMYDDEVASVDGMIGRENWSTRKKPAPVHHNSHMTEPRHESWPPLWEAGD
jgi:hypothetical protein